jgi:succinoglycan biosynthesis protein ExoM
MKVVVCVATYRRPVLLGKLLESLGHLTFRKHPGVDVRIVVIDNDAAASARPVVERARSRIQWPLAYAVEPERNISLARNRGVELALAYEPDFLAFIDDDEAARPAWLDELIDVQRHHGADVVGGVVLPRYENGVPQWILNGGFFRQPTYPAGAAVPLVHTNNSLVARRLFDDTEWRFDPGFGLSGGGDCHFFMRARRAGVKLIWADTAVVEETIPPTRTNSRWILRRAFRVGNAGVYCERAVQPVYRWLPLRVAKAGFRLVEGVLLLSVSPLRGRAATMRALCKIAHGAGSLAAIGGMRYREYLVTHGE